MSIYYLSPDHYLPADAVSGERCLPAVAFSADAFHRFDAQITETLDDLESKWVDPSATHRRPPATAWRFRRKSANRER